MGQKIRRGKKKMPGIFLKGFEKGFEKSGKDIPIGWQIVRVNDTVFGKKATASQVERHMDNVGKASTDHHKKKKQKITLSMVRNIKLCVAYDHTTLAVGKPGLFSLGLIVKLTKGTGGFGLTFGG